MNHPPGSTQLIFNLRFDNDFLPFFFSLFLVFLFFDCYFACSFLACREEALIRDEAFAREMQLAMEIEERERREREEIESEKLIRQLALQQD